MGFLDNLKDRIVGNPDDDYYDDYDEYDEEEDTGGTGILGNSRRPEADSVNVYTRSGRPLNEQAYEPEPERGGYDYDDAPNFREEAAARMSASMSAGMSAAQLPPYIMHPTSYDEVQLVVRRVRTRQPVVLVLKETDIEVAKRILDFSFGLSFGINGSVEELGDGVFAVLPGGAALTQTDIDRLVADGTIAG